MDLWPKRARDSGAGKGGKGGDSRFVGSNLSLWSHVESWHFPISKGHQDPYKKLGTSEGEPPSGSMFFFFRGEG